MIDEIIKKLKMNKKLKITLLFFALMLIVFVFYLNYQTYFSESARKGKANLENIKKIQKGMEVSEVVSIMGRPNTIDPPIKLRYPYTQYNYKTNDESYANVTVVLDSTMKVKETYFPKQ